jgi:hypothetical protein
MIQIHGLTSLYGLGTAKKADLSVVAGAKFVAKLKDGWYERSFKRRL